MRRLALLAALLAWAACAWADAGKFTLEKRRYNTTENGPLVEVKIIRTGPADAPATVSWVANNEDAEAGIDYGTPGSPVHPSGYFTWASDDFTPRVITVGPGGMVPIIADGPGEPLEAMFIDIVTPNPQPGDQTLAQVYISDDANFIGFADWYQPHVSEAGPNIEIVVERVGTLAGFASVHFTTIAGGEGAMGGGVDLGSVSDPSPSGTILFAPGESRKVISVGPNPAPQPWVPIVNDTRPEAPAFFNFRLDAPVNASMLSNDYAAVWIDSDDRGITFAIGSSVSMELDGPAPRATVLRMGPPTGAVSVNYSFEDNTAINGVDYVGTPGTLTWADGDSAPKEVPFLLKNDSIVNGSRWLRVHLANAVGAPLGNVTEMIYTIGDDDTAVKFAKPEYWARESAGTATIAVERIGIPLGTSVTWTTEDGDAIAGQHFGAPGVHAQLSGTLTWAVGDATAKTITIPVINDPAWNPTHKFTVRLGTPTGGFPIQGSNSASVSVVDDKPTISFALAGYTVTEGGPVITVRANRAGPWIAASAIWTATNGTAIKGKDFSPAGTFIVMATGMPFNGVLAWHDDDPPAQYITIGPAGSMVAILDDGIAKVDAQFKLVLTSQFGVALGDIPETVITIAGNDPGFAMTNPAATIEAGTDGSIQVSRLGTPAGATSVSVTAIDETGILGTHYSLASGRVTTLDWADGDGAPKSVPIHAIATSDVIAAPRTFSLALSAPTVGVVVAPSTTRVTLASSNNTVQWAMATASVAERAGAQATLSVTRVGLGPYPASVQWVAENASAMAGTDFGVPGNSTPPGGIVTWAAGDMATKYVTIPIIDNATPQVARTFSVRLQNPAGTNASIGPTPTTTVTITDADAGVAFATAAQLVNEAAGSVSLTVARLGRATDALSVSYATTNGSAIAGRDYTARSGIISWPAGDAAAKTITVPILNNMASDGTRAFSIALSAPTAGFNLGVPSTMIVSILDDDIPAESAISFVEPKIVVVENGGDATLTVRRAPIGGGFTVPATVSYATHAGTALTPSDFTAKSGTLTWAVSDSADKTITVPIVNNALAEPPESFKVTLLSTSPGARVDTPEATITILDDDELFPPQGAVPGDWTIPSGANAGWHVSNEPGAYEGVYSLRSDEIADGETAQVEVTRNFAAGNVTFRVRISSEPVFDQLRFFVDGVEKGTWSGTATTGWTLFTTPVTAGTHTLRWSYEKDGAVSVGSDAAWIDAVTLP